MRRLLRIDVGVIRDFPALADAAYFDFWRQPLPGLVLFGLGLTITVTPLTSAVLAAVEPSQSGIGSAINNAVSRIAGLIAVAFAGVIAGSALDYDSFRRLAAATAGLFAVGGAGTRMELDDTRFV